MIKPTERKRAITLIKEAVDAGSREYKACNILEISSRTLRRWKNQLKATQQLEDQRQSKYTHRSPTNRLTQIERERIISICNQKEYQSLPPSQIVPILADKGVYIKVRPNFRTAT